MKKLLTLTAITLFSLQATAASNIKFVAVDQTLETNLCFIAAEQGFDQAKLAAQSNANFNNAEFEATICNGLKIKRFARKFQQKLVKTKSTAYRFELLDNTDATRYCAIAAQKGLEEAVSLGGEDVKNLICNGRYISSFARKYQNS